MATRTQFRHEDVATVPRGWKVRTVTQASGHQARIAFPPGPRRRGAGRLISILHPQGENPGKCAVGRRQKAVGSNPREPALTSILHKPSGKRYWLHLKRAWGKVYYSFDGENWDPSKVAAFKHAEAKGALQESAGSNPRPKQSFEEWMEAAERISLQRGGLSLHDLPDCPYADWYESGVSAASAVSKAKRYAMGEDNPPKSYAVEYTDGTSELVQASSPKTARQRAEERAKRKQTRVQKVKRFVVGASQWPSKGNPPRKTKTREQVEKMQAKAVKFLRDVVKDDDKADEIEALSLEDYAAKKKVTLGNPRQRTGAWQDVEFRGIPKSARLPGGSLMGMPPGKKRKPRNPKRRGRNAGDQVADALRKAGIDTFWANRIWDAIRQTTWTGGGYSPIKILGVDKAFPEKGSFRWVRLADGKKFTLRLRGEKWIANPNGSGDAAALYQKFHGKAPKEVLELQESAAIRGEYTSLGDLVELVVKSPAGESLRIGFEGEKVKLASSPNGGQLYFLGGKQALDGNLARFKTDATKDLVDLGEAQSIVYRAAKDFTGFKSSDWEHEFGEESGERPSAFYDKLKQRIFLVGGTYRVERPGIVD